ncbi:MAG: phosphoribosylformylglycinamidine synthase II [Chlamydiae bacterium RIFCSPHIGHO2_12_FULL_49_9]|nr:MAG: phosphoribosylformylglycinamidine synthase II [Chlamydiae bacterium RIFCSPHIGHO2_12_FULL_49_9]
MEVVSVFLKPELKNPKASELCQSIKTVLGIDVERVAMAQVYRIYKKLSPQKLKRVAEKVLLDPVSETAKGAEKSFDWCLEIGLKEGLTDNLGLTAQISIEDFLKEPFKAGESVRSSIRYFLKGKLTQKEVRRIGEELLANRLIEEIRVEKLGERLYKTIDLPEDPKELLEISRSRQLALNLDEMQAIRNHYASLQRAPTDVEIEAIAQTWSEHCKHKIFQAKIRYLEDGKETLIDSLFSTYIKKATALIAKETGDWLVSVFKDNAGIVRFNGTTFLTCKVETHNSPSALDPYGGALTGILGVNRDILGTGTGSKPIANMDVLCFAPPDYTGVIPEKLQHPKRVLKGVCKGIEHGGNKSGIPTVNGALVFDQRFLGKPLVYCGTIGLMAARVGERGTETKEIQEGDWIVLAGGRTGKDGIHGATFSSEALHAESPTSAVQIGDPFTQKKLSDFLIDAQKKGLYRTLTDNGAGGISSSVGEMALITNGCEIHLEKVPLKYPNLAPWEILVSESQERMTLAVGEETKDQLQNLADFHEVEIAFIGNFTKTGLFHVLYEKQTVALLTLDFLHAGAPQLELEAETAKSLPIKTPLPPSDFKRDLHELLLRYTICSKESIVRQYDHEVQGASSLKPFVGIKSDGPGDASILWPIELQKEKKGIVVSNGICPRFSDLDAYAMGANALSEAICNQVAVGANPSKIAILDNFCWPDPIFDPEKTPDGKHKLAQLVQTTQALYDGATLLKTPIISGKDSMKNDYQIGSIKISIPPTLLITAVGEIPDVEKAVSMDVKEAGDLIYVLGLTKGELGGSEYFGLKNLKGGAPPSVDYLLLKKECDALFSAMQKECIASCHDCSEGGLGVALAESSFAGGLGLEIDLKKIPVDGLLSDAEILFSESAARFVITVDPKRQKEFENEMQGLPFAQIGVVRGDAQFIIKTVFSEDLFKLKESWQSPLRSI